MEHQLEHLPRVEGFLRPAPAPAEFDSNNPLADIRFLVGSYWKKHVHLLPAGFVGRILRLPREIRHHIYEYVIVGHQYTTTRFRARVYETVHPSMQPTSMPVGLARWNHRSAEAIENGMIKIQHSVGFCRRPTVEEAIFDYREGCLAYFHVMQVGAMAGFVESLELTNNGDERALTVDFKQYFWKSTILDLTVVESRQLHKPEDSRHWLESHNNVRGHIQNISLDVCSETSYGGDWGVSTFAKLCRCISASLPNLRKVYLWAKLFEQEVEDAVNTPGGQDWVQAFRKIPVKVAFELRLLVINRREGAQTLSGDEPKPQWYLDELRGKYEATLGRLLKPASLTMGTFDDVEDDLGIRDMFLANEEDFGLAALFAGDED